jgi:hypothetical protein
MAGDDRDRFGRAPGVEQHARECDRRRGRESGIFTLVDHVGERCDRLGCAGAGVCLPQFEHDGNPVRLTRGLLQRSHQQRCSGPGVAHIRASHRRHAEAAQPSLAGRSPVTR